MTPPPNPPPARADGAIEPADARYLRLLASCYHSSGEEPTDEQVELIDRDLQTGILPARLRALAGLLEQSRNGHISCMCDACYHVRRREP
jgi:hypothetical protein